MAPLYMPWHVPAAQLLCHDQEHHVCGHIHMALFVGNTQHKPTTDRVRIAVDLRLSCNLGESQCVNGQWVYFENILGLVFQNNCQHTDLPHVYRTTAAVPLAYNQSCCTLVPCIFRFNVLPLQNPRTAVAIKRLCNFDRN